MAAASYEWAVSADGEDWSVVETEDDDTFAVTADLLGMYVKVTVTAEDGETASDVTTEKVAENEEFGQIEIVSAEATKANEITVTLANSVISSDTTIEVTKGSNTITVTDSWNDTFDVVTLTAAANLTEGLYMVTLTSEDDPTNTDTATFEVTGRYVKEIVIDCDTALTQRGNKKVAYAHYDVLDNYGESVRNSTSIMWAGSATITADKTTGKLTITKTSNTDWVYGEQIYVTGVYSKTGLSTQKTLTVGTEQALDSLEIAGFVKKGTTNIVKTLPADFKPDTYYILFNALDQNGTQLKIGTINDNDVTFVSDNVLVVKEVGDLKAGGLTVNGVEYEAAFVEPGIRVSEGGAVTVTAIANKTGNKTEISMVVGIDAVVTSFTLSAPAVTVADGDTGVEIPFVALDEDGNQITKFDTLAKQATFNTLSFTASEGDLVLAEQKDGSAKLTWSDSDKFQGAAGWAMSQSTDGIDRPISLTVVVVGGGTDNEMISVSDKRRPDAILSAKMDEVYTEGAAIKFYGGDGPDKTAEEPTLTDAGVFESFQFVDQYGQTIKGTDTNEKFGDSTGFFMADSTKFSDQELKNHAFGVRVLYAGSDAIAYTNATGTVYPTVTNRTTGGVKTALLDQAVILPESGTQLNVLELATVTTIASAATGEGFKFEIAKFGPNSTAPRTNPENWESVSPAKFVSTAVVDLSQVKSFTISDLNKFYVGPMTGWTAGGQVASGNLENLTTAPKAFAADASDGIKKADSGYQQDVSVKGTWNGKSVSIPKDFYTVAGSKVTTTSDGVTLGDNKINAITATQVDPNTVKGLAVQDLYDASTAKGVAKDAKDTLKATLYNIYGGEAGKNNQAINYYDYKVTADTATSAAAKVDADNQTGVDKAVEQKTIAFNTKTKAEIETLISDANARLTALSAELTAKTTAKGIVDGYVAAQAPTTYLTDTKFYKAVYDTTSIDVLISDQAPTDATITGLEDSYEIAPWLTTISNLDLKDALATPDSTAVKAKVKVLDQYGKQRATEISYRATNIVENKEAYAQNNFTVSGNDSNDITFAGVERGDTFTLVLKAGGATAETTVAAKADQLANITNDKNNYLDNLIDMDNAQFYNLPGLEQQRLAGLS